MADLEGKTIAATYRSIVNVGTASNQELDATPRVIADGAGNASALWLATGSAVLGVDDTGTDVRIYSATASEGLFYDASEDELGLLLTTKLKFHDIGGGEEIYASADGHLEINAGTTLDITAPTVDLNSATEFNIDTAVYDLNASGAITMNGSTIDVDGTGAMQINSSGGTIGIGNDDVDQNINIGTQGERTINIGTGSFADEVVIGNTTGASGVHLKAGTGDVQVTGNVGIGTASPESTLHVLTANVGTVAIDVAADDFVIENTTTPGMTILGNNNATGSIFFGFEADPNIGRIQYNHSANRMDFTTNNDKIVVIDNAGNVGIGTDDPARLLEIATAVGDMPIMALRRGSATDTASFADGDGLGQIEFYAHDGDTAAGQLAAKIVVVSADTWDEGTTDAPGRIQFHTQSNGVAADGLASPRMVIDEDGSVGIGIVAPANTLEVRGKTSDNCHFALSTVNADYDTYLHFAEVDNNRWSIYNDGVGGTAPGGGTEDNILTIADDDGVVSAMGQNDTTFAAPSDERMKENMVEMTGALENISDFRCVHYNFIHDRDNGKDIKRIGIIAQDIYKKYPEAVKGFPDSNFKYTPKKGTGKDKVRYTHEGAMSVKYPELIPVLIKAIQELSAEVEKLKNG